MKNFTEIQESYDDKPYTEPVYVVKWNVCERKEREFTIKRSGAFIAFGTRADVLELFNKNLIINKADVKRIFKLD